MYLEFPDAHEKEFPERDTVLNDSVEFIYSKSHAERNASVYPDVFACDAIVVM